MRRLLALGLVLGTMTSAAGCGGRGGHHASPPPNAEKTAIDMKTPGASLQPPPATPGAPAKKR